MKKILFMMLAAVLFMACSNDDDEQNKPGQGPDPVEFADLSSTVGMSYANMLKTYGEPSMNFGSFYVFEQESEKVESIICMVNPATESVYSVMQTLAENAYTAEQINAYFASKYFDYGEAELDYDEEDLDEGEDIAVAEPTKTHLYGNAKNQEEATLIIEVYGNSQVVYTNPALVPEEPEGPDMSDLNPRSAVAIFMGADIEDLLDEYGDALQNIAADQYLLNVDNEWLMAIGLTIEEGKVVKVVLLYNEDLTDEDIIEYYKEFGYSAMPFEGEEEGEVGYLFMNMTTMDMFTYMDGRAEFVDLSNAGGEDWDDEDYDDEED